jgi:hypothetical protein
MKNYLFELKIKEFEALNKSYKLIEDILFSGENYLEVVGCVHCYRITPEATIDGYKIPKGNLLNLYECYSQEAFEAKEVALNSWLCPHCGRLFKELLPKFDLTGDKNVSI